MSKKWQHHKSAAYLYSLGCLYCRCVHMASDSSFSFHAKYVFFTLHHDPFWLPKVRVEGVWAPARAQPSELRSDVAQGAELGAAISKMGTSAGSAREHVETIILTDIFKMHVLAACKGLLLALALLSLRLWTRVALKCCLTLDWLRCISNVLVLCRRPCSCKDPTAREQHTYCCSAQQVTYTWLACNESPHADTCILQLAASVIFASSGCQCSDAFVPQHIRASQAVKICPNN